MLHMLLSLAEWERGTIRDRIQAGVQRAAAEGRSGGRPPALSPEKRQAVRDFLDNGGTVSAAARTFGVSRPTVRAVRNGGYAGRATEGNAPREPATGEQLPLETTAGGEVSDPGAAR